MKMCICCNKEKQVSEFGANKRMSDGLNQYCKMCAQAKNKNYRQKYLYGLDSEKIEEILEAQGYRCAICGTHRDVLNRDLHIDHCHDSDKVRGLLCVNCNVGLGHFKDSVDLLTFAIAYLNNPPYEDKDE